EEPSPTQTPTANSKSKSRSKKKRTSGEATPTPSPAPDEESSSPGSEEGSEETPGSTASTNSKQHAPNATISPNDLSGYDSYPPAVRKLIDSSLALTRQNLDYTYGSADPSNGGMDCSGFVYFVLRENGLNDVPRDSSEQYIWLRKVGKFNAVLSRNID